MDNTFDLEPASEDEEISHTLTRQDIFMDSTSVPTATDCVNDRFRLCNAQEDTLNLSSLSVIPTRYLSTIEEMSTELTMAYEKINNLTSDV